MRPRTSHSRCHKESLWAKMAFIPQRYSEIFKTTFQAFFDANPAFNPWCETQKGTLKTRLPVVIGCMCTSYKDHAERRSPAGNAADGFLRSSGHQEPIHSISCEECKQPPQRSPFGKRKLTLPQWFFLLFWSKHNVENKKPAFQRSLTNKCLVPPLKCSFSFISNVSRLNIISCLLVQILFQKMNNLSFSKNLCLSWMLFFCLFFEITGEGVNSLALWNVCLVVILFCVQRTQKENM